MLLVQSEELCRRPCTTPAYKGTPVTRPAGNRTIVAMANVSGKLRTRVGKLKAHLNFSMNCFRFRQTEFYVQTLGDIVGGVGGSLGLFIGFSFWGVILYCSDKITNKNLTKARERWFLLLHISRVLARKIYVLFIWMCD